jgi:integrase
VHLVFTTDGGAPLRRSHLSRYWRAAVAEVGAPHGTTFHDLRHLYASLIRHGESAKVVQARLGHARAAGTLDTYAHLWSDSDHRTRLASTASSPLLRTLCGLTRWRPDVPAGQAVDVGGVGR